MSIVPPDAAAETPGDLLVFQGQAVKALGDGRIGGYAVVFSGPDDADLTGDYFDAADSDFWLDADGTGRAELLYDHGMDDRIGPARFGSATLKKDDRGVWFEAVMARHDEYADDVMKLIEAGVLGISTGAVSHLVRRQAAGRATKITSWPIYEVSVTPTPAEPRTLAVPLKSLIPAPAAPPAPEAEPAATPEPPAPGVTLGAQAEAALDAVKATLDRLAAVADLRAQQGRTLSAERREQAKALSDALAELHARSAPAPDPAALAAAARLRLLRLQHQHRTPR